jgi:Domain of unknown function (DUF4863)
MSPTDFQRLVAGVTASIAGKPLNDNLADWLNATYPAGGPQFDSLFSACRTGIAEGWLCQREAGGIRYGRVLDALPDTHGFSVDVVDMADIAGPHHTHPHGEIDLIMPLTEGAHFDGHPAGWRVYGPATSHRPTVSAGRALILYLLPAGAIEFTRRPAVD